MVFLDASHLFHPKEYMYLTTVTIAVIYPLVAPL